MISCRAESLGLGCVIINDDDDVLNEIMREALDIPTHIEVIVYLCVAYASKLND
jgi:hypothetical protein